MSSNIGILEMRTSNQWISAILSKIMGSSKRKASFRIDDILQQQQQQNQHQQLHNPLLTTTISTSSRSSSHKSSPELVIDTMNANQIQNSSRTTTNSSTTESNKSDSGVSTHHAPTTVEPPYGSPSGSEGAPRKPHPVYPSFPADMQKHASNFYLPLSLGMPQFSPAAYLEHYANALQKGEFVMGFWRR